METEKAAANNKKSCYLYVKLNSDLLNILANLYHNYFGPFRHPKAFVAKMYHCAAVWHCVPAGLCAKAKEHPSFVGFGVAGDSC